MPHILESYALHCGLKQKRPIVKESFYPVEAEKYITVHNSEKVPAKKYDLFTDVLNILKPTLQKEGIKIVQLGAGNDIFIDGADINLCGKCSIRHTAYILKHALLHLGVDSAPAHIASVYDKKMVILYGNANYPSLVKPYWSSPENLIIMQSPITSKLKPSYSFNESPKLIDHIQPEKVAKSVCDLLNLKYEFNYESLYIGAHYLNRIIEGIPDQVAGINNLKINSLIMRADILFNEDCLYKQLQASNCSIVTRKTLSTKILQTFSKKISEIVYIIDEMPSVEFVDYCQRLGIKIILMSYLSEEKLIKYKRHFYEYGTIHRREIPKKEDFKELKELKNNQIFYRSNKFILSQGRVYPSIAAYRNNLTIENIGDNLQEIIDEPEFWEESENFYFLKTI